MSIDARLDVLERRILAQGKTPEEWAVEVAHPVEGVWTTMFYVGVQGFRLAFAGVDTPNGEGEEHPGGIQIRDGKPVSAEGTK